MRELMVPVLHWDFHVSIGRAEILGCSCRPKINFWEGPWVLLGRAYRSHEHSDALAAGREFAHEKWVNTVAAGAALDAVPTAADFSFNLKVRVCCAAHVLCLHLSMKSGRSL